MGLTRLGCRDCPFCAIEDRLSKSMGRMAHINDPWRYFRRNHWLPRQ